MTTEMYDAFQAFQNRLAELVDEEFQIDTVFGSELFQRLSDAAFEFYQKQTTT